MHVIFKVYEKTECSFKVALLISLLVSLVIHLFTFSTIVNISFTTSVSMIMILMSLLIFKPGC